MNEIRGNNEIEKEERDNPEKPTSDSNNKQPKENVDIKSNNDNSERIWEGRSKLKLIIEDNNNSKPSKDIEKLNKLWLKTIGIDS